MTKKEIKIRKKYCKKNLRNFKKDSEISSVKITEENFGICNEARNTIFTRISESLWEKKYEGRGFCEACGEGGSHWAFDQFEGRSYFYCTGSSDLSVVATDKVAQALKDVLVYGSEDYFFGIGRRLQNGRI